MPAKVKSISTSTSTDNDGCTDNNPIENGDNGNGVISNNEETFKSTSVKDENEPSKVQKKKMLKMKEENRRLVDKVRSLEDELEKANQKVDSKLVDKIKHLEDELKKAKKNQSEAKFKAQIEHLQEELWLEKARNSVKPKMKSKNTQTNKDDSKSNDSAKHLKGHCSNDMQKILSHKGQIESELKKTYKDKESLALELEGVKYYYRQLEDHYQSMEEKVKHLEADLKVKSEDLELKNEMLKDYKA